MFNTIAVGTDGTETAGKALEVALDLARRYDAQLLIFTAFEAPKDKPLRHDEEPPEDLSWTINPHAGVDAILATATSRAEELGVRVRGIAREGEPAVVICDLSEEFSADLLVIGNKGMQRRILGSVPNTILHHAPCSVVLAKTT
jgi:nucleotide-binding universal stress UspA family protein